MLSIEITIISGSSRTNSNSLKVAKALKKLLIKQNQFPIQNLFLADLSESDIPMIGKGNLQEESLTKFQKEFITSMKTSHLIFLCLPEYNWTNNPEITNLFHQIGNKNFYSCFHHKVFATAGVSTGRGGRMPCVEMHTILNKIISFMDAYSIVSPMIFESHETEKNIDTDGNLLDNSIYNQAIQKFIDYSLEITQKWLYGTQKNKSI